MLTATTTRYIIKPVELKMESTGGIILKSTNDTQFAEIISIGTKVLEPLPLGAKIIVDWNQTVPLKHENTTYYVVDYRAVVAVLEE